MPFAVRLKRMQDLAEETGEKMADIMDVGAPPPKEEEPEVVAKEPSVEPPPEDVRPSTPPATVGSEAPPNTPFPAVESSDPELQERLSDLEEQLRGAAAARDDLQRELAEARRAKDSLTADYEARLAEAQNVYDALVAEQATLRDRADADLACVSAKDHFLRSCEDAAAAAAAAARENEEELAEARAAAARAERARACAEGRRGRGGRAPGRARGPRRILRCGPGRRAAVVRAKDGESWRGWLHYYLGRPPRPLSWTPRTRSSRVLVMRWPKRDATQNRRRQKRDATQNRRRRSSESATPPRAPRPLRRSRDGTRGGRARFRTRNSRGCGRSSPRRAGGTPPTTRRRRATTPPPPRRRTRRGAAGAAAREPRAAR